VAAPELLPGVTISLSAPLAKPPCSGSSMEAKPVGQNLFWAGGSSPKRKRKPENLSERSARNRMTFAAGIIDPQEFTLLWVIRQRKSSL
jgi:hypothetical protein